MDIKFHLERWGKEDYPLLMDNPLHIYRRKPVCVSIETSGFLRLNNWVNICNSLYRPVDMVSMSITNFTGIDIYKDSQGWYILKEFSPKLCRQLEIALFSYAYHMVCCPNCGNPSSIFDSMGEIIKCSSCNWFNIELQQECENKKDLMFFKHEK